MAAERTILVTGGAGYIGGHVTMELAEAGYRIVTLDLCAVSGAPADFVAKAVVGNVGDQGLVAELLAREGFDAVIHLAGYIESGESVENPGKYYENNIVGSLRFLAELAKAGAPPVIFSSSAAVYGGGLSSPLSETEIPSPETPYAVSKLMIEQALAGYRVAHGLRSASLRYFNAAGADPGGRAGEDHDPETHLIPIALQAAAGRRDELVVNGTGFPTADGSCVRDYVHVSDLATAHRLALDCLLAGDPGGVFNVGTGQGHSVLEVAAEAGRVTGQTLTLEVGPPRPGDTAELVADPARFKAWCGWEPRYVDLADMVRHAWAWEQAR